MSYNIKWLVSWRVVTCWELTWTRKPHLQALVFLYAFEDSDDCHLLSSFCDDSNLHISLFKYGNGNGNGLLFHMTQPISRSTIKAIACSKPTISEHYSKWEYNGTIADQCKQRGALCHIGLAKDRGQPFWHNATSYFQKFGWNVIGRAIRFHFKVCSIQSSLFQWRWIKGYKEKPHQSFWPLTFLLQVILR